VRLTRRTVKTIQLECILSILEDAEPCSGVECGRGGVAARRAEGERRLSRQTRPSAPAWWHNLRRVLAVGAVASLTALIAAPGTAVASTTTTGPGSCQWHAGITCPYPWPIDTVTGQFAAAGLPSLLPASSRVTNRAAAL